MQFNCSYQRRKQQTNETTGSYQLHSFANFAH